MEFFDSHGVTIDKNTERKIENIFFREDFRRTPMESVGHAELPRTVVEAYSSGFLRRSADGDVVGEYARRDRLRHGNASLILPRILSNLGVEMIALNAFFDNAKVLAFARRTVARHLEQLGERYDFAGCGAGDSSRSARRGVGVGGRSRARG